MGNISEIVRLFVVSIGDKAFLIIIMVCDFMQHEVIDVNEMGVAWGIYIPTQVLM